MAPLRVDAVTFDDFGTLRYAVDPTQEDIIHPIWRVIGSKLDVREKDFLKEYSRIDEAYRTNVEKTMRESLLDNLVEKALVRLGEQQRVIRGIVRVAVDQALSTRKTRWFPGTKETLRRLLERGYPLGLISNTHWRMLPGVRNEFMRYFSVITLSYEHGYVKPSPSIFQVTLKKLGVRASRCLHVGDDPLADVRGAGRAGMKTAFVSRRHERAEAEIGITHLSELIQLL